METNEHANMILHGIQGRIRGKNRVGNKDMIREATIDVGRKIEG